MNKIEGYFHHCTIGDLKKFIEKNNLPDDSKVVVQRIEDFYFKEHHWKTINKENESFHNGLLLNENIESGELNAPELSLEDLEDLKTKYIVVWCPVKYENDNNLYLDCHY